MEITKKQFSSHCIYDAISAVYFKSFLQLLVDILQSLQIFRFFKNAYLEETKGCFLEPEIKYQCDYCLLMITESAARIDYEAQDFSNAHCKQGIITLICHGKDAILEGVQANSRFFISVSNFGKLLYSLDGLFTADSATNFDPRQVGTSKHSDIIVTVRH